MKREQVFERDGYRCVYCGEAFAADMLTVDHVQPRMKGGDSSGGNLVTACRGCNTAKGGMRLSHFLLGTPAAREHFVRHAVHVWPRILRALEDEMRREKDAGSDR